MTETFEISRVFRASRDRVWEAWTNPEQLAQWLGPKGARSDVLHFELKPGGSLHTRLTAPDGSVSWGKTTYREIVAPGRLVWEQGFSNEAGDIVQAPFPMPWPRLMLTTIVLEPEGENTRVSLSWQPIAPSAEELASFGQMLTSMTGGWTGAFDQLDDVLAHA